jgi:protein gp37
MKTKIPWTDRVWNCTTGCKPISPGCMNCYARKMANRLKGRYGYPKDDPFKFTIHKNRLNMPLHWSKPSMVFVDSMSDLFYPEYDEDYYRFLAAVFGVMAYCEQHTFQILTKRPEHAISFFRWLEYEVFDVKYAPSIREYCAEQAFRYIKSIPRLPLIKTWPLRNVWILVSAEDQELFNRRVPYLFGIPSIVHGVSIEPMLGPVGFRIPSSFCWNTPLDKSFGSPKGAPAKVKKLDWVIVGSEKVNGRPGRHFAYQWARDIRDVCVKNEIPFYFKQAPSLEDNRVIESPELDGRIWNEFPRRLEFIPEDWKGHLEGNHGADK